MIQRVKALDINNALLFVFSDSQNQEFILYLNRIGQIFEKGIDSEGEALGVYSPVTESLTRGRSYSYGGMSKTKTAGERFFLLDTGELFDSFRITVGKESFTIDAYTIKDGEDLTDRMGNFVGLTEESQNELIERIKPQLVNWIINVFLA